MMSLNIEANRYYEALFRFALIISCTLCGNLLDCVILLKLKSRENTLAVLLLLLVAAIIGTIMLPKFYPQRRYILCFICLATGALVHWSQKLGYTCSAMSGNMFKLIELLFKIVIGYISRTPKLNGELVTLKCLLLFSFVGAVCAVIALRIFEDMALLPLLLTILPHLHYAGCFRSWGWVPSGKDKNLHKKHFHEEGSGTEALLRSVVDDGDNEEVAFKAEKMTTHESDMFRSNSTSTASEPDIPHQRSRVFKKKPITSMQLHDHAMDTLGHSSNSLQRTEKLMVQFD